MIPSLRIQFLSKLLYLILVFGSLVASAQDLSPMQRELIERPHFLEGILDPEITMSVIKIEGQYLLPEQTGFLAVCNVIDRLTTGSWPDTVLRLDKDIMHFGTCSTPSMMAEIPGMELLVFEANREGRLFRSYGVPSMRLDAKGCDWSQMLIDPLEAELLVRELWTLIEQKYTGEIKLKDSAHRIIVEAELLDGMANGLCTFRYFGTTASSGILQERQVEFSSVSKKLMKNEVEGRLLYDYKKTSQGYSEFSDWGLENTITERIADHVSSKQYFWRDGADVLLLTSEIDVDSTGNNNIKLEQFYCDANAGEFIRFSLSENGVGWTSMGDSVRKMLFPQLPGIAVIQGTYFPLLPSVIDTLHSTTDDTLRRISSVVLNQPKRTGEAIAYFDTLFQRKTDNVLSEFRILNGDTNFVFTFDLFRGYGVLGGNDLSVSNALARIFEPSSSSVTGDFWPIKQDFQLRIQSDTFFRSGLSNGILSVEETLRDWGKHGEVIKRYSTGQVALTGNYFNRKPSGIWNFYEWDGSLRLSFNFDEATLHEQSDALLNAGVWTWMHVCPSYNTYGESVFCSGE